MRCEYETNTDQIRFGRDICKRGRIGRARVREKKRKSKSQGLLRKVS